MLFEKSCESNALNKQKIKLYVLGGSPIAKRAIKNLRQIFTMPEITDLYEYEIIDLLEQPDLAENENILATPVLIKKLPPPLRHIIGDLSDRKKVLVGLDILPPDE